MAYLALYRMFRPRTLDEVIGQKSIVKILQNQIKTGRIGHAYLFCGPRGTGKTSIAKIFANAINCESPINGSPCGKCASCRALADPSNLDISEIDAASNNGVDEMRDLRERVQYPPVAGKYKVYIIDEVHMLSTGAFNALLKTLEEPPAHVVFILATTESQKIPATILSRCMRFDFKLISQEEMEDRLRFVLKSIGKEYEEEAVSTLARAGAGCVRDMLSLADTCVSYSSGKLTGSDVLEVMGSADSFSAIDLVDEILNAHVNSAIEKTEQILSEGKSVGTLIKDVLNDLNAIAVAKTCRDANKILSLPEEIFQKIYEIAKRVDGKRILRLTEIFGEAESALRYAGNARIVFETAVFKGSMPQEDYDITSLAFRIQELEKKINSGNFSFSASVSTPIKEIQQSPQSQEMDEENNEDYAYYSEEEPPPEESGVIGIEGTIDRKIPIVTKTAPIEEKKKEEKEIPNIRVSDTKDSKAIYGGFLRALRKIGKNGVLFTVCMDLDSRYEGGTFILSTDRELQYNMLKKEDHYKMITEALSAVGITDFKIELKAKPSDDFDKDLKELKNRFSDVKIEVK